MKDESGGRIMKELVALRAKTYSCLIDDRREIKKDKGTKKCVVKTMLRHVDHKNCVLTNEIILKSQQRFKSKEHNLYTEEVNKIALMIDSNDDKKLQTFEELQHIHMVQVQEKYALQRY